jgi:hypothetical protein
MLGAVDRLHDGATSGVGDNLLKPAVMKRSVRWGPAVIPDERFDLMRPVSAHQKVNVGRADFVPGKAAHEAHIDEAVIGRPNRTGFSRSSQLARPFDANVSLGPRNRHAGRARWHPSPSVRTRLLFAKTMLPVTLVG